MEILKNTSRRIISYDFFRGIISVGLIFFLTFYYLHPTQGTLEFFYRWASLGFLFFSGLLIGESLLARQKKKYFIRRGLQILGIFFGINFFLNIPSGMELGDFAFSLFRGDFSLVLPLLLPLGVLFLCIPLFSFLPAFLGLAWAVLLLLLFDFVSIQKGFVSLNSFFLSVGAIGFFLGQIISLERIRYIWNKNFIILPFLSIYIALAILLLGELFQQQIFLFLSFFWSFHFIVLLLFYFALPSSLFKRLPNVPRSGLRKFFEPFGVDMFFIYVFLGVLFEVITRVFPHFFINGVLNTLIMAVHITIMCFFLLLTLHKIMKKNKKFRKIFRFIF